MKKLTIIASSICVICLTACYSSPKPYQRELKTSYVRSKMAEYHRAYAALPSYEKELLDKHFTHSYVEDYVLYKRSGANHAQQALSELVQQAVEMSYKKIEKDIAARHENDERERRTQKPKVDCDLISITDFIPSPISVLKPFQKLKRLKEIEQARRRGDCK